MNPEGMRTGEKIALAALAIALVLVLVNYLLGGLDGLGYVWFNIEQAALDFISWRINVYVLALVPILALGAGALRHSLPVIQIPLRGAGDQEAKWLRKWYWPGSYRIQEGEATWREGRYRAYVNKTHISRQGLLLGLGVTVAVERNVDEATGEVTYDPVEVPAYRSRTLHRRLQLERRAIKRLEERMGEK
jgi:hypothetical protein